MPNDQDDPEGWSGDYIEVRPEVAKMIEELGDDPDPEDIQRAVDRLIEEHPDKPDISLLTSILNYFLPMHDAENVYELISMALIRIAFVGYVVCAWALPEQIYIMNYNLFFLIGIAGLLTTVVMWIVNDDTVHSNARR